MIGDSLGAIYARVPDVKCKGKCQQYCGPIYMSGAEAEAIERVTGLPLPLVGDDLRCPFLSSEGRCEVYAQRPLVCRVWGAVPELKCPWGCRPERPFSSADGAQALARMDALDGRIRSTIPK